MPEGKLPILGSIKRKGTRAVRPPELVISMVANHTHLVPCPFKRGHTELRWVRLSGQWLLRIGLDRSQGWTRTGPCQRSCRGKIQRLSCSTSWWFIPVVMGGFIHMQDLVHQTTYGLKSLHSLKPPGFVFQQKTFARVIDSLQTMGQYEKHLKPMEES